MLACDSPSPGPPPAPPTSPGAEAPPPPVAVAPSELHCGNPTWEPHRSEHGLFSLEFPSDWKVKALEARVFRIRHPEGGIEIANTAGWLPDATTEIPKQANVLAQTYQVLQNWETQVLATGSQTLTAVFDTGRSTLRVRFEVRPQAYLMTTVDSWVPFDDTCAQVVARYLASLALHDLPPPHPDRD